MRLFLARVHTTRSRAAKVEIQFLNTKALPSYSYLPLSVSFPLLKVLSPPPSPQAPKPGDLCLRIKICRHYHNREDILTIANSPFLSMCRINEAGANEEKLDRKETCVQILIWSISLSK